MGYAKKADCIKCGEWIGQCACEHQGASIEGIVFDEWPMIEEALKTHPHLIEEMQKEGSEHWQVSFPPIDDSEEIPF